MKKEDKLNKIALLMIQHLIETLEIWVATSKVKKEVMPDHVIAACITIFFRFKSKNISKEEFIQNMINFMNSAVVTDEEIKEALTQQGYDIEAILKQSPNFIKEAKKTYH